jgi:hypothetical protein
VLAESEELSHIHLHENLGCVDESVVRSVCLCVCVCVYVCEHFLCACVHVYVCMRVRFDDCR